MSTPKVTVLMSVLNGEEFLAEAIDSILTQSFTDFEFIIVDNASTDRTPEIIRSYDDARVIHLRNSETLNLSQSLNKGLAAARGDYIARLDADDVAMPGRLEKQVRHLEDHSDVALVATAANNFGNGVPWPGTLGPIPPTGHDELVTELARANIVAHSSIMFRRREVQDIGGYPTEYSYCMDYLLYFRLARRHRLAALREPLVAIRAHPAQITSLAAWRLRREQEIANAFLEIFSFNQLSDSTRRNLRRYFALITIRLIVLLILQFRFFDAFIWLGRAFVKAPDQLLPVGWQVLQSRLIRIRKKLGPISP